MSETWALAGGEVEVATSSPELVDVLRALLGEPSGAGTAGTRVHLRIEDALEPALAEAIAAATDGVKSVRVADLMVPTWCTSRAGFTLANQRDVECAISRYQPSGFNARANRDAPFDLHPERFYYRYLAFALQLGFWRAGYLFVHGAVLVAPSGRSVLIAGRSGSGKSTLCIALLEAGWRVLSDDSVYASVRGDVLIALARPMHLDPRLASHYPRLACLVERRPYLDGRTKVSAHPTELYPDQLIDTAPFPTTILLPRIEAVPTSTVAATSSAAALAILHEDTLQVEDGEPWFPMQPRRVLERLVGGAACVALVSGRDALEDPTRLVNLVEEAGA